MRKGGKGKEGFTLLELMIVVAIIGILAAIAVPRFIGMKDRSIREVCRGNLKNIQLSFNLYQIGRTAPVYPLTADIGTGQAAWAKLRQLLPEAHLPVDPVQAKIDPESVSYFSSDGESYTLRVQAMDSARTAFSTTPGNIVQE